MAKRVKPAISKQEQVKEYVNKKAPWHKSLLKEIEPPEVISSALSLDELKMKDLCWSMKLIIHHIMPKSFHDFKIKFVFNEKPFENNIAMVEDKLRGNTNRRLFSDMNKADIDDLNEEIAEIKSDMEKKKTECPTIEFIAQVEELKYSGNDTILKVSVPDHIIESTNEVKMRFGYYRVELQAQV
jgi:hypothetical protein